MKERQVLLKCKSRIEVLREELYKALNEDNEKEVLRISQKLDIEVLKFVKKGIALKAK